RIFSDLRGRPRARQAGWPAPSGPGRRARPDKGRTKMAADWSPSIGGHGVGTEENDVSVMSDRDGS
ncbi:MAG: hypothetical protein AB7V01_16570, partial [Vicinamibacterales bacterium]